MTDKSHIRLVSSFSDRSYPFIITKKIHNPYNPSHVETAVFSLREAVSLGGIKNYKLFEKWGCVELHLRTEKDYDCAAFILSQPDRILVTFDCSENQIPARLLKKRCKIAEKILSPLVPGTFEITPDPKSGTIIMHGSKEAFIIAARMEIMTFISNRRHQTLETTDIPSTAVRNSPPTPERSPGPPV